MTYDYRLKSAAVPTGKAQKAIMQYLDQHKGQVEMSDMMRHPSFRTIHQSDCMNAAQTLKKKGLIKYDGVHLESTKAARPTQAEQNQIAHMAHKDAEDMLPTGVFNDNDPMEVAKGMASSHNLEGFAAELYVERMVGHVINFQTSGKGV